MGTTLDGLSLYAESRDMTPRFTCAYSMDDTNTNGKLCGNFAVRNARFEKLANDQHIRSFDFGQVLSLTTGMIASIALLAVSAIVFISSTVQMAWIHAKRSVASVQDEQISVAIGKCEGNAMCSNCSLAPVRPLQIYKAVPIALIACPKPTFSGATSNILAMELVYILLSKFKRLKLWSGHVVLLQRSMCQVVGVGFQRLNASPILA